MTDEEHRSVPLPPDNTPPNLIQYAVGMGTSIENLEKLLELNERWESKKAEKSFFSAMTKFQSVMPAIRKTKKGHNYKYAPLGDIAEQIRTPLAECRLSYRFEINSDDLIKVTCIVTHEDGHSVRTSMSSLADSSGSKNEIQANGSAVSYLQRYSLIGALGLTTADEDIDARLPLGDVIDDSQIEKLEEMMKSVRANKAKFLEYLSVKDIKDLPASKFNEAINALMLKKSKKEDKK